MYGDEIFDFGEPPTSSGGGSPSSSKSPAKKEDEKLNGLRRKVNAFTTEPKEWNSDEALKRQQESAFKMMDFFNLRMAELESNIQQSRDELETERMVAKERRDMIEKLKQKLSNIDQETSSAPTSNDERSSELKAAVKRLMSTKEELEREKENSEASIRDLELRNSSVQNSVRSLETERDRMKRELAAKLSEQKGLVAKVKSMESDAEELKSGLEQTEQERSDAIEKIKLLEKQLALAAKKETRLEELQNDLQSRSLLVEQLEIELSQVHEKVTRAETELENSKTEAEGMRAKFLTDLDTVEKEKRNLMSKAEQQAAELERAHAERVNLTEAFMNKEAQAKKLNTRQLELKSAYNTAVEQMAQMEDELKRSQQYSTDIQATLKEGRDEIEKILFASKELKGAIEAKDIDLRSAMERIALLEQDCESKARAIKIAENELNGSRRASDEAKEEIAALRTRLATAEKQLSHLNNRVLPEKEAELQTVKHELSGAQTSNNDLESQRKEYKLQVEAEARKIAELEIGLQEACEKSNSAAILVAQKSSALEGNSETIKQLEEELEAIKFRVAEESESNASELRETQLQLKQSREKVEELKTEIGHLILKDQTLQKNVAVEREKVDEAYRGLSAMEEALGDLQREMNSIEKAKEGLSKKCTDLEATIETRAEQAQKAQNKVKELEVKVEDSEAAVKDRDREIEKLKFVSTERVEKANARVANLSSTLEEMKLQQHKDKESFSLKEERLLKQIEDEEARAENACAQLDFMEQSLEEKQKLQQQLGATEDALTTIKGSYEELSLKMESELESLVAKLSKSEQERADSERGRKKLENEKFKLMDAMSQMQAELSKGAKLVDVEGQVDTLTQKLKSADADLARVNELLDGAELTVKQKSDELEKANENFEAVRLELEEEISKRAKQKEFYENEIWVLRENIASFDAELDRTKTLLADKEELLSEKTEELARSVSQFEAARREYDCELGKQQEMKEQQEELTAELRAQIASLSKDLGGAENALAWKKERLDVVLADAEVAEGQLMKLETALASEKLEMEAITRRWEADQLILRRLDSFLVNHEEIQPNEGGSQSLSLLERLERLDMSLIADSEETMSVKQSLASMIEDSSAKHELIVELQKNCHELKQEAENAKKISSERGAAEEADQIVHAELHEALIAVDAGIVQSGPDSQTGPVVVATSNEVLKDLDLSLRLLSTLRTKEELLIKEKTELANIVKESEREKEYLQHAYHAATREFEKLKTTIEHLESELEASYSEVEGLGRMVQSFMDEKRKLEGETNSLRSKSLNHTVRLERSVEAKSAEVSQLGEEITSLRVGGEGLREELAQTRKDLSEATEELARARDESKAVAELRASADTKITTLNELLNVNERNRKRREPWLVAGSGLATFLISRLFFR
ncbi:hypothetical protein NDN08_007556 [Rhodosorus marinus]|uniref:GRIP domain-containing protein n=1 Tax=Rhodosorus marinus TaxID=101924 RepID=A0AAV8UXX5_9RHOD|nr:hypothetical protein NDN08_007556 [Rhodosorus marinus]